MRLQLDSVSVAINGAPIISTVDLDCQSGEFVGLLGPNGSGKSTALKTIYRAIHPHAGVIRLDDTDLLAQLSARAAARHIAAMTQEHSNDFPFTVREVVATGRVPHKHLLSGDTAADHRIVDDALATVGLSAHTDRAFGSLSGGEKQRVLLARALTQQPRVLILDEPTNHLDIATQLELLTLISALPITVLAALHDLNLAAAYCDRIYLLSEGRIVTGGPSDQVLTPEVIADVFGVHVHRGTHPVTGRPHLAFSPLHLSDTSTTDAPPTHNLSPTAGLLEGPA